MMVRKLVSCILVQFKPATGVETSYWSSIPEKLNQDRRERNREHGSSCTSILYSHRSQPGGNSCILILCFYSLHSFPYSFIPFFFHFFHQFVSFPLLSSFRSLSTSFFIPFPFHFFLHFVPFPQHPSFRSLSTSFFIPFLFHFVPHSVSFPIFSFSCISSFH